MLQREPAHLVNNPGRGALERQPCPPSRAVGGDKQRSRRGLDSFSQLAHEPLHTAQFVRLASTRRIPQDQGDVMPPQRITDRGDSRVNVDRLLHSQHLSNPQRAHAIAGFQPSLALVFVDLDDLLRHPVDVGEQPGLVRKQILICPSWSVASRTGANRPIERALAIPIIGDLLWALASDSRQRTAVQSAFAPGTPVPDQFVADMRARGRRSLRDSSRAIDDYLRARPLAERLQNLNVATELVFGEHDARVSQPADEFAALSSTHVTVLPGVGHSPPWEAPDIVAELITTSLASWPRSRSAAGTATT
jgi:hypothetical protein